MSAKENFNPTHEKTVAAPPPVTRAGEGVKAAAATAAGASVVTDGRGASANVALPVYVPARRRSRRNLLL